MHETDTQLLFIVGVFSQRLELNFYRLYCSSSWFKHSTTFMYYYGWHLQLMEKATFWVSMLFVLAAKFITIFIFFLCSSMVHVKGVVNFAVHYGKEYVYIFQLQIVQNVKWGGLWIRNVARKCSAYAIFLFVTIYSAFRVGAFLLIPNKIAWVYWCTGIENNLIWMLLVNKVWWCKSLNGKSLVFGMYFPVVLKLEYFFAFQKSLAIILNAEYKVKWLNKFKSNSWFLRAFFIVFIIFENKNFNNKGLFGYITRYSKEPFPEKLISKVPEDHVEEASKQFTS